MDQEIKITGEPDAAPNACRFIVDRPVFPDDAAYFPNADEAAGSPLAERLFAIDGIGTVMIADTTVAVTKNNAEPWPNLGKQIGAAIRSHIQSGQPAVSEAFLAKRPAADEIRESVQRVLDEEISPAVASHGGSVALVDVKGSTVFLQFGGGCQGCGMASVTLKHGVERSLRAAIPGIGEILDITDHAAGRNPYFASA